MSLEIFQQLCSEFCQNSSQESKWHTIYFQSKWRLSFDAIFAFIPRIGHSKNIALALLHYCGSQYYRSLTWNVVVISAFFDCLQFDEISSQKKIEIKKKIFKCTFCKVLYCILSCLVYFELIKIQFQEFMLLLIVQTFTFGFGYLQLSKSWFDIN